MTSAESVAPLVPATKVIGAVDVPFIPLNAFVVVKLPVTLTVSPAASYDALPVRVAPGASAVTVFVSAPVDAFT